MHSLILTFWCLSPCDFIVVGVVVVDLDIILICKSQTHKHWQRTRSLEEPPRKHDALTADWLKWRMCIYVCVIGVTASSAYLSVCECLCLCVVRESISGCLCVFWFSLLLSLCLPHALDHCRSSTLLFNPSLSYCICPSSLMTPHLSLLPLPPPPH